MENQELFVQEESPKVSSTTIVCPHCNGEIIIERKATGSRGQLAGIALEDMTDEQLKRETINAKSVLYKAVKRNAPADLIARNKIRVAAAEAEKAKRAAKKAEAPSAQEAGTQEPVESSEI